MKERRNAGGQADTRADPPHPLGRAAALGNAAVQRLLCSAVQRSEDGSGPVDDEVARTFQVLPVAR